MQEIQQESETVRTPIIIEPQIYNCSGARCEIPNDRAGKIKTYSTVHRRLEGSSQVYDPKLRNKKIYLKKVCSKTEHHQDIWDNMGTVIARTTEQIGR